MPLYEYRCDACAHQFEKIQRFSDDPITVCPSCQGGPVVKLLSSPAIQFKGSGWYITDYARKGGSAAGSSEGAKSEGSASSSEKATPSAPASATTDTSGATKKD